MQQVLPVQTGLYRYDKWLVQVINDKNLNGTYFSPLTELNGIWFSPLTWKNFLTD